MERTKEIELRLEKATPGPWKEVIGGNFVDIWCAGHHYSKDSLPSAYKVGESNYRQSNDGSNTRQQAVANAKLIAASPDDLRYLLDRVKSLEELLQWLIDSLQVKGRAIVVDHDVLVEIDKAARALLAPPATERSK